ncbi:hypothetical protein CEUSTIGMA_g5038.t1 [Chlamydomonas eustigma]|uniref:Uncharacterized protein n=1 Tax=Chlamydomonas eustigma TaxID=1157962 RepID=A0A250X3D8_9CHLO|nr:hypothetical protein CEUSTIGMA_g5038.t1 [Chlamydomonas eustigma]|eukprot:GAX77594.1 hypothetical protein CEUSTIGMA_g5038.t1 [Chlamydomonas eustigma]
MASRLRGLAQLAAGAIKDGLPQRGGAGAPIKLAPRPDKPLPLWYEMWWDNGVFPGQPAADFMWGPLPANLTETFYAKAWAGFLVVMGAPLAYLHATTDEFSQPMVPQQFPPEVRQVLEKHGNTSVIWDYSQPDYEQLKARRARYWTPM